MSTYKINEPHANAEVFEDEVVVVNLLNGNYYSILNAGFDIWRMMEAGYTKDDIFQQYSSVEGAQADVETFFNDLVNLELIKLSEEAPPQELEEIAISKSYMKPTLEQYTDMQDLLMLDPIHEVDKTGWPKPADKNNLDEKG